MGVDVKLIHILKILLSEYIGHYQILFIVNFVYNRI